MRKGRGVAAFIFFLLCALPAWGQYQAENRFQFTYANDFFRATDYYFTQGLALAYSHKGHRYRLVQEGYTPTSIRDDRIRVDDRPYAGALYVSYGRDKQPAARGCRQIPGCEKWGWAMDIGVTGPPSLAAAEQEWIHRQTGNIEPRGWKYQIATDVILAGHLYYSRQFLGTDHLTLSGNSALSLGSYKSRAELSLPIEIGIFAARKRSFGASLYAEPVVRIVGYDATLQGGFFNGNESPYVLDSDEVKRVVGALSYGLDLYLYGIGIDFSYTYLGKEFGSGRRHSWGTARLSYSW